MSERNDMFLSGTPVQAPRQTNASSNGIFAGKNLVSVSTSLSGGAALGLLVSIISPALPLVFASFALGFGTTYLAIRHESQKSVSSRVSRLDVN